jgi:hypothetical protein
MRRGWASSLPIVVFVAGCSLNQGGTLATGADGSIGADATLDDATVPGPDGSTDAGTNDVVVIPDANDDAPAADAGPCTIPPSVCGPIPGPWKLVVYQSTATLGCPATWAKTDYAWNPGTQAGACTCGCKPTPPTCKPTTLSVTDGANAQCGGGSTSTFAYAGNCTNTTLNLKSYLAVGKVVPTGGACAPGAVADPSKLTLTVGRACAVPPQCMGDVCANLIPAGFEACVVSPGDVACSVPGFTKRSVVGVGANLACGDGTCACNASPSCGGGVDFFGQPNCQNGTKTTTIPADETCNAANFQNGSTVQSVRYVGAQPNAGCAASGTATTQAVLDKPQTICCR